MVTVACVLRSGGIYNATWVERLKAGVDRNLTEPHNFVCLSDVPAPRTVPLKHGWEGWWSKMELFALHGPVLFFDLDTLIIGDLGDIVRAASGKRFVALRDFYRQGGALGSGMMYWENDLSSIYQHFRSDPDRYMNMFRGGDQFFIEFAAGHDVARWQDIVPGQVVSYKVHAQVQPPAGARVVCLHGMPKFGDMPKTSWARQLWEAAA